MSRMHEEGYVDVVICGGGIAGLTLALLVRKRFPSASVALLEKTRRPLPTACHKVGESAVELGSHYLAKVVGLDAYMQEHQLYKNGLRFFSGDGRAPLAERPEIGPVEFPIVHSFQYDRGNIETDLREMVEQAGVTLLEGAAVRGVDIQPGDAANTVTYALDGVTSSLRTGFVADASGRGRLLQKQQGPRQRGPEDAHAAWFRVAERITPSDFVPQEDSAFHARDVDGDRWLSTTHYCGLGYWFWQIPLASGFTSFGVVISGKHHDLGSVNKPERLRAFLEEHEPALAARLRDVSYEDFRSMPYYAHVPTRRSFSADGWSTIGEASVFVDPLYSMGLDFIGLGASMTTRLIGMGLDGSSRSEGANAAMIDELEAFYTHWVQDMLLTLTNNGRIFPHPRVFGAKLWWDFVLYWSFHCRYFFDGGYEATLPDHQRYHSLRDRWQGLNRVAQSVLEAWAATKPTPHSEGPDRIPLPMFPSALVDLHLALQETLDTDASLARIEASLQDGEAMVTELVAHALRDLGALGGQEAQRAVEGFLAALGDQRGPALERLGAERIRVDALPRRQRLAALPPIGRDLERAIGRTKGDIDIAALLASAEAPRRAS